MARMSEAKGKKTTIQKGGATKVTKLPAQSNKTAQMPTEQNGSVSNYVSDKAKPFEPVSLIGSSEDGGKSEPVSDASRSDHDSEDMNAAGRSVSDSGSAMHHRIAEKAFMLFQQSGCQDGRDWADWFEAERQITQSGRDN